MSFFFDVWTKNGFILTSDVKLTGDPSKKYAHKIAISPRSCKTPCAIVVCGVFPEMVINNYFLEACSVADTSLRDIAECFGKKWTERFSDSEDYSAVHICGFSGSENIGFIPQMWYWTNWDHDKNNYKSEEKLKKDLESFSKYCPNNNWTARFGNRIIKMEINNFETEKKLTSDFLEEHAPFYTWNGDSQFWRSAAESVGIISNLLQPQLKNMANKKLIKLTKIVMWFLLEIAKFVEINTVSSKQGKIDIVRLELGTVEWIEKAKL